jgi:competence protein ComEC
MSDAALQGGKPRDGGPRYQPLVIVAVAVCAGIVADRYLALPVGAWWAAGVLAWALWLLLWRLRSDRTAGTAILAAAMACGGAWHHCRWHLFARDDLGFFTQTTAQPVCLQAVARTGPRRQPTPEPNPMRIIPVGEHVRLDVEAVAVRNGAEWQPASGRARLVVSVADGEIPEFRAGDRLQIFAQAGQTQGPLNPGELDFAWYARAERRLAWLRAEDAACVTVVSRAGPLSLARWIDGLRSAGARLVADRVNPAWSGVGAAVLLGIREEVPIAQTEAFVQTGTIHILSISGLHVGILAAAMFLLVRLAAVRRIPSAAIVAGTVVFYVLLTDAEPPAVRAMVIVLVMCAGYACGRRPLSFNVLAAAALVVLAINPADLFRVGVQLSFLCVAVLCWFGGRARFPETDPQRLEKLVAQSRPRPVRVAAQAGAWAWDLTWVGALVWLATIPLVMARFHMLPVVGLVLNTLLWLPATAVVWTGLALLAIGGLVPLGAAALGWCCDRSLALLQWAIEGARQIPGAYFWVPGPAEWWLLGFYGGLGLWAALPSRRPPRRWCLALAAGWLAAGMLPSLLCHGPPRLTCTFLAVDHGCAVVLRLPSGQTMLYDAGHYGEPEAGVRSIAGYLWSEGITHLDAIVLSHADADHFNAVPGLLERFSVGAVYVSPVMFKREEHQKHESLTALRECILEAGVPVREISAGDRLHGGEGCRIEVLHPLRRGSPANESAKSNDNANSIVLAVEYLGKRLLLPGDLEPPGLADVVAEAPWPCDVLLAPHHGSLRSDAPTLAAWASPKWVVVSGGHRFNVSRTLAAYRQHGAQVLHTAQTGAIEVQIDAAGLNVKTFR